MTTREQRLRELVAKLRESANENWSTSQNRDWAEWVRDRANGECSGKRYAAAELEAILNEPVEVSEELDEGDITAVAIAICEADGGDPHNLLWTGGAQPEPWGDEWCRYRKHAVAALKALKEPGQ